MNCNYVQEIELLILSSASSCFPLVVWDDVSFGSFWELVLAIGFCSSGGAAVATCLSPLILWCSLFPETSSKVSILWADGDDLLRSSFSLIDPGFGEPILDCCWFPMYVKVAVQEKKSYSTSSQVKILQLYSAWINHYVIIYSSFDACHSV